MKRSKHVQFWEKIISIDRLMTSKVIWHDVKIWPHHISFTMLALLWKFSDFFTLLQRSPALVLRLFVNYIVFTKRSLFTDVEYPITYGLTVIFQNLIRGLIRGEGLVEKVHIHMEAFSKRYIDKILLKHAVNHNV